MNACVESSGIRQHSMPICSIEGSCGPLNSEEHLCNLAVRVDLHHDLACSKVTEQTQAGRLALLITVTMLLHDSVVVVGISKHCLEKQLLCKLPGLTKVFASLRSPLLERDDVEQKCLDIAPGDSIFRVAHDSVDHWSHIALEPREDVVRVVDDGAIVECDAVVVVDHGLVGRSDLLRLACPLVQAPDKRLLLAGFDPKSALVELRNVGCCLPGISLKGLGVVCGRSGRNRIRGRLPLRYTCARRRASSM